MISIIISSYQPEYFAALKKNVAETCGVEYEIIKIDNPGKYGISEAYNKGAAKAKYDYLLFVHEDVFFHTQNWGLLLQKYFDLPNLGVLGLAGSRRKFQLPYGYFSGIVEDSFVFLKQKGEYENKFSSEIFPFEIKIIDGVFIGMKKKLWQELPFDESLKGFHSYDLDISLRSSVSHKNYLVTNLDFEHFSKGNFGDDWVLESIEFNKRNFYNYDIPTKEEKTKVRNFWFYRLQLENVSFVNRLKFAFAMGFSNDTLRNLRYFLIKR